MKDSEFIELLNLYLDHEISAVDADRIEREVRENPARRQIYQDYCRLQKACTLLAKDYVEQSSASGSTEDRKLVAFQPRRSWGAGVYLGGFAAAAACVTVLVFANRPALTPAENAISSIAVAAPAPSDTNAHPALAGGDGTVRTLAQTVNVSVQHTESRPIFTTGSLRLSKDPTGGNMLAANQPSLDGQFDWLRDLQLSPLQRVPAENLRFDAKADLKVSPKNYGPMRVQSDVQNAAFQFQR